MTTKEVENLHCFFAFKWIELKFSVRLNFRFMISNLNSKAVLLRNFKKMTVFFSKIMSFSPALPNELAAIATINYLSSVFQFQTFLQMIA